MLDALRRVKGPDLSGDLVSLGLVSEVVVLEDKVYFSISVDPSRAEELEPMRLAAEKVVSDLDGVSKATVTLTAERPAGQAPAQPRQAPQQAGRTGRLGSTLSRNPAAGQGTPPPPQARGHQHGGPQQDGGQQAGGQKPGVPGIRHIIAVASGKGGVGKSTTAVNLALGLQAQGLKVGILDADIYGPSQPRLLGVSGRPEPVEGRILRPLMGYGVPVMSMGFLVEEDTPMIWRGPMVMSALTQMLREVMWGELDVLVVDMPPGTGDAQLTMAQQVPLSGAVIVSTPQDLALIDARKGINMFRKVDVPILGVIENMSYFLCPSCGTRSDIFGYGGAHQEADRLGVEFLGEVPLHMDIRELSDAGRPVVVSDPDGPHATIFKDIASRVWSELQKTGEGARRAPPRIVMES
ncbi:Scaffold protein for [4Fe-4S] cluster assembly ApbC [Lutibaculum baratangense AMV1]|uniref:Iron-sulfur cluster carrier protein n=1 Tax=Lutibaculum baratangense AMV1 TaxID=631454 RepID=V4RL10_9HYPH|nr:Scaffold protein for [4Fe-4S] cluster assembly ApbC [Lutibaculum baratangense AMV1]